jgi:hypothetical protein
VDTHSPQGITRNSGQPLASSNPHWWTPTAPMVAPAGWHCWTPIAALRAPTAHGWPPTAYALGYEAIVDTHCGRQSGRQSWTPAVVRVVRGYRLAPMEALGGVSPQTHCLVVHVLNGGSNAVRGDPPAGATPDGVHRFPIVDSPQTRTATVHPQHLPHALHLPDNHRAGTPRTHWWTAAATGGHPQHATAAPARHPTRYSAHPLPTRGHPARDHAQTPTARLLAWFVSFVDSHGGSSVNSHRAATTSFVGIHCGPRGAGHPVCAHLRFHGRQSGKTLTAAVGRTGRPWTPKVDRGHPRLVVRGRPITARPSWLIRRRWALVDGHSMGVDEQRLGATRESALVSRGHTLPPGCDYESRG